MTDGTLYLLAVIGRWTTHWIVEGDRALVHYAGYLAKTQFQTLLSIISSREIRLNLVDVKGVPDGSHA